MRVSLADQVHYTAGLMDEIDPEWAEFIDTDELDIEDGDDCAFGQIFEGRLLTPLPRPSRLYPGELFTPPPYFEGGFSAMSEGLSPEQHDAIGQAIYSKAAKRFWLEEIDERVA